MHQIKRIIELYKEGRSIWETTRLTGLSRNRRGVTRQLLWEEYRKEHPEGYAYSQFCEHLRQHSQKDQAVMHFTHQAGEQLQVDFAGDKSGYVDISTGEWIACEVLACTMPYSNYMYGHRQTGGKY